MSRVIEINSSDDEPEPTRNDEIEEVLVLSGESNNTETNNNTQDSYNIDLTNDQVVADLVTDLKSTDVTFTEEFLHFLKLSYDLESSDGMKRIIMKNIVPSYIKADKHYLDSNRFKTFILNLSYKLNTDPHHKFSHLKELSEVLKKKKVKKSSQNHGKKRKKQPVSPSKRQKCETIDLDAEVSITEKNKEVIIHNDEKENSTYDSVCRPAWPETPNQKALHENLEEPMNQDGFFTLSSMTCTQKRIEQIEAKIQSHKMIIDYLETQEVNFDDEQSPYIILAGLKAETVMLYKKLCSLKGEVIEKPKPIKLHPAEGHHPGPSKKIESWLNSHMKEDGLPQFPDLFDVIQCVTEANNEWNLSWNKQKILHEARLLFTQCGKALQRRRQRRGWRELSRAAGPDPAHADAALQARLEENRRQGRKRETDILEYYVLMESKLYEKKRTSRLQNSTVPTPGQHYFDQDITQKIPEINSIKSFDPNSAPKVYKRIAPTTIEPKSSEILKILCSTEDETSEIKTFQDSLQDFIKMSYKNAFTTKIVTSTIDNNVTELPNNIALPHNNNNSAIREMSLNSLESQMENENNTNKELDKIENVKLETIEASSEIKQEAFDETDANNEGVLIEHDIPIERDTINPELDILEATETVVGNIKSESLPHIVKKEPASESDVLKNEENNPKNENVVKTEVKVKSEEDNTLKLMLEFDEELTDTVITTIIEAEEPVVYIEISSSDDESDSEPEKIQ